MSFLLADGALSNLHHHLKSILKNEIIAFRANSFASYVDQGGIFAKRFSPNLKDRSGVYSLKAKTIYNEDYIFIVKSSKNPSEN